MLDEFSDDKDKLRTLLTGRRVDLAEESSKYSSAKMKGNSGGPRGRVVKVADFSALNHSIISPLWVRASLGARVTCGTSQVLLAGVSGGFSPGTPVFAPPTD